LIFKHQFIKIFLHFHIFSYSRRKKNLIQEEKEEEIISFTFTTNSKQNKVEKSKVEMEVRTLTSEANKRSEVKRGTDGFLRVSVFLFFFKISVCTVGLASWSPSPFLFCFAFSLFPSSKLKKNTPCYFYTHATHVYTFDFLPLFVCLFWVSFFLFIGRCGLIWLKPSDGVERCKISFICNQIFHSYLFTCCK